MAILFDSRGNEINLGQDKIVGETYIEPRVLFQTLASSGAEIYTALNGQSTFTADLRATAFSGTIVLEGSMDGSNYYQIPFINMQTQAYIAALVLTGASNTVIQANVAGFYVVRLRVSAYTSGSINVYARAGTGLMRNTTQMPYPSTLWVTATAAANTGFTLTLPAAGAGLFHYITHIDITRNATAALAGGATLIYTTTNLPGSPAWSVGNNMVAGGTEKDVFIDFANPMKSSAANTATTIVAPAAGAAVLARINVAYFVGA